MRSFIGKLCFAPEVKLRERKGVSARRSSGKAGVDYGCFSDVHVCEAQRLVH